MTISFKHKFTSAKSDSADTTLIRPSNWNDEHNLTLDTDRLIGRDTVGNGAAEEIVVTGGLEFTGTGGIQRSALTGDVTASAGSNTTTIANDAVTYAKIQNVSTSNKILGRATAGAGDIEEIDCTAAGRALLDDVDAAAQRTTLGLGTLATQNGTFSGTSSGTNTGDQNVFQTIAVAGQSNVVADSTSDTLTIAAGSDISITTNATTDTVTIAVVDNPQFTTIELGNASDTTISRSAAGVIAVEGGIIPKENRANTFSASQTFSAVQNSFSTASGGVGVSLDSAAATFRVTYFKTAGLNRWTLGADNSAESGSNAGTGLFIYRYDDAGAFLGTPLYIDRATGQTTLSSLNCGTIDVGNIDTTITRSAAGVIAVEGGVIPKENRTNTFSASQIISVTDNTNAALRVTQLGTGNAILVEDSTNPDATPFMVDANGLLVSGYTQALTVGSASFRSYLLGSGAYYPLAVGYAGASVAGARLAYAKSRGADWSTRGAVVNGDIVGENVFVADDGTNLNTTSAIIRAAVDGTVSTGVVPGSLVFLTANSAGGLADRVRITSAGNVGIGTSTPGSSTASNLSGKTAIVGIGSGSGFNSANNYSSPLSLDTSAFNTNLAVPLYTGGTSVRAIATKYNSTEMRFVRASTNPASGGATIDMIIDDAGNVLVNGAGGLGYGTGSGGAVTQATSRTTGVTLNKTNGAITLVSAAGSATWQSFTVTNSTVAATDTVIVSQKSGTDLYQAFVTNVAAGSFRISFATTGGTTTEQPVFNFSVIKAVTS